MDKHFKTALRVQLPLRGYDFFYYMPHSKRAAVFDSDGVWRIYTQTVGGSFHDLRLPVWSVRANSAGSQEEAVLYAPYDYSWGGEPIWWQNPLSGLVLRYDAGLLAWVLHDHLGTSGMESLSYYVNREGSRAVEVGDKWWQYNSNTLPAHGPLVLRAEGVDAGNRDDYVLEEWFSDVSLETPADNMPDGCGRYSDGTLIGNLRLSVGGQGAGEGAVQVSESFDMSRATSGGEVGGRMLTLDTGSSAGGTWSLRGPGGREWRAAPPSDITDNAGMTFSLHAGPADPAGWPSILEGVLLLGRRGESPPLALAAPGQALMVSGKAWR